MKPNSALDLLPLIGDEQKFREAISWYEEVTPKPWRHKQKPLSFKCHKCNHDIRIRTRDNKAYKYEHCPTPDPFTGSLAELEFELRDKAIGKGFNEWSITFFDRALVEVWKACNPDNVKIYTENHLGFSSFLNSAYYWIVNKAKPEHWICIALYALELAKKGTER